MKNRKTLLAALVIATLGFMPSAFAGLHLEPFLGYQSGDVSTTPKTDFDGIEMGGRVGFHTLGFSIGGEMAIGDYSVDTNPSTDFDPTSFGVFAAYEFPILIRVYGTYVFSSSGDYGTSKLKEGSGTRLGVGFTGLPFVAINVEMLKVSYEKIEVGGTSATLNPDLEFDSIGINVSVPFTL